MRAVAKELIQRITAYLCSGGLWNPELANHFRVRDLLMECRDELARQHDPTRDPEAPSDEGEEKR